MAFDLRKSYGFDKKAAEEGVKMVVGPDEEKDYVLICKLPNKKYRKALVKTLQDNSKLLEMLKTQDPDGYVEKDNELNCEVLAETIIIGWGPGFGAGGKAIKYSVATCKKLLMEYPDFKADCLEFATDNKNYPMTAELDVEDVKKS